MAEGQIELWIKKHNGVLVKAVRLNEDNAEVVRQWCGGDLVEEIDPEHPDERQPGINVPTPLGHQRASLHMYVIQYGAGKFTVSHARPFEMVYQPLEREEDALESAGDARRQRGFSDPFDLGRRM